MEVSLKGGTLVLKHKLKRNELYKISKSKKFQSLKIFKKPQLVKGFSNVCEDLKGILIIDYDGVEKDIVLEDYAFIQDKFKLPPAYLFTTKPQNFHIICLYKAPQSKIFRILTNTRCDSNFISMPLRNRYRSYAVRISDKYGSGKPKFIKIIGENKNLNKKISQAHLILISKIYKKINHPKYENIDSFKKIKIKTYETS